MDRNEWYRSIPKVDALLEDETIREAAASYGRPAVLEAIRCETDALRERIRTASDEELSAGPTSAQASFRADELPVRIAERAAKLAEPDLRHVINATGVVLHTNLGRAPLNRELSEKMAKLASGYSNLEYDLDSGGRGERYSHFASLLCRLTGAEDAMAVNNNAAAVLLTLSAIAGGGEVITSRGELVEIGGKFRVPEVCEQGGARLVEVGTTNRTHLSDYLDAVTEETKAFLKVHTSNYRIVGFSESVPVSELAPEAEKLGIPVIEDLGSGSLIDLSRFGFPYEPTVQEAIASGADVVCFSGDKLLGGPQAGIILGKKNYLDRIKRHPLTRALRIDKMTVTALELTLLSYQEEARALKEIPSLAMLTAPAEEIRRRAEELYEQIADIPDLTAEVISCMSEPGGGSLPTAEIPGFGVAVRSANMSVNALEEALRKGKTPVVARICDDALLLDVRTVFPDEVETLAQALREAAV